MQGMPERLREESPRDRCGDARDFIRGACRHDLASAMARAGTEVDDVPGAPDGVLVVLDHHERVPPGFELC
jgi:hypothetical protein